MELVGAVQQLFQQTAEYVASYRPGQLVLRQMDRALWVLEKSARWAVPPPLDQDERPQPELVRPLPWALFLVLLLMLRVTRESISIFNLVIGKPPLHSADVVVYLQCKRRYLRALKYQGNRTMRARRASADASHASWLSGLSALFEFTMCFRRGRESHADQGNANSEQILVVGRQQAARDEVAPPAPAPAAENTMERLIERMMVDLNTDSDDDSNYTLTNAKNSISDPDSDNGSSVNSSSLNTSNTSSASDNTITNGNSAPSSPNEVAPKPENASTPTKTQPKPNSGAASSPTKENSENTSTPPKTSPVKNDATPCAESERRALSAGVKNELREKSPKKETESFVANERAVTPQRSPKKAQKLGMKFLSSMLILLKGRAADGTIESD